MNARKFTLVISATIMIFLFAIGTFILSNITTNNTEVSNSTKRSSPVLGGILGELIKESKPVNILVLGGDKVNGNTDTMMLVNYDPSTTKANVVSIPRDTKVYIEDKARKINFAYPHGGAKLAVETVSGYLGVNIKYYIYIDISVFRKIIDMLGGIDNFYVPQKLDYDDDVQDLHIHLEKGYQDLDGAKAEQFMRYRGYNRKVTEFYNGSDIKRIEAQHTMIKELIRQKANIFYIHKFNDVVTEIFDNLETNMMMGDILNLAQNIGQFKPENFVFHTLPGTDGYEDGVSYFFYDRDEAEELMKVDFQAEEGFDGSENPIENYNKYRIQEAEQRNEAKDTNNSSSKDKDYTKNNPSNSSTNIKKEQEPEP